MSTRALLPTLLLFVLVACGGSGGGGGPGTPQRVVIHFDSVNPENYFLLASRTYDTTPVGVFGTLLLPADVSTKVPAMVIAHGTSGVTEGREFEWAEYLVELGIAAFVVDSYTLRGDSSSAPSPPTYSVADALKALELLAAHPDIDADRIGVMGGSRGGQVAYVTAFEEIRTAIIDGDLAFAAHIPFYPNCNLRRWSPNLSGSPLMFLLGGSDDYTPADACVEYVALLEPLVPEVTAIVYPSAFHGFDFDFPVVTRPLDTLRDCAGEQRLDTFTYRRYDTGESFPSSDEFFDYIDGCRLVGVRVGANAAAEAQARIDVADFLLRVLDL